MNDQQREQMMRQLHDLADLAEHDGLWLQTTYQQITLTPAEARQKWAEGVLRWGVLNWRTVDPAELRRQLAASVDAAKRALDDHDAKVAGSRAEANHKPPRARSHENDNLRPNETNPAAGDRGHLHA